MSRSYLVPVSLAKVVAGGATPHEEAEESGHRLVDRRRRGHRPSCEGSALTHGRFAELYSFGAYCFALQGTASLVSMEVVALDGYMVAATC